jgi:bifunctional enzyme CysN/CysC
MPWYNGPSLIEHLETVEVDVDAAQAQPFRMPVQWVNRPIRISVAFQGLICAGSIKPVTKFACCRQA